MPIAARATHFSSRLFLFALPFTSFFFKFLIPFFSAYPLIPPKAEVRWQHGGFYLRSKSLRIKGL
jgi:hypothetical protein